MRVSVDPTDFGFSKVLTPFVNVYFDGRRLTNVVEADEDKGEIRGYVLGPDQKPKTGPDGKGLIKAFRGKVELRLSDDASPAAREIYEGLRALEAGR